MGAIVGLLCLDGRSFCRDDLSGMVGALRHRASQGADCWTCDWGGLARLTSASDRPASVEPGVHRHADWVLVMEGHLENSRDVSRSLELPATMDMSGPELVLRAYQRWGRQCLSRLDGDFTFVLVDVRQKTVLMARDRTGQKTLFYAYANGMLAFATELHPLLALPWVGQDINIPYFVDWWTDMQSSLVQTPWTHVSRLAPAHVLEADSCGCDLHEYWSPDLHSPIIYADERDYAAHYLELLTDAIRRKAETDAPLACEVSGGLDSSAVYAIASLLCARSELMTPQVRGYTLDFEGSAEADESRYVSALAQWQDQPIHRVLPALESLDWYSQQASLSKYHVGYPNLVMSNSLRRRAANDACRVVLTGHGGDEWVGGTGMALAEALVAGEWGRAIDEMRQRFASVGVPSAIIGMIRHEWASMLPERVKLTLKRTRNGLLARLPAGGAACYMPPDLLRAASARKMAVTDNWPKHFDRPSQKFLYQMLKGAYSITMREVDDRLAALCGVEIRRPFFDYRIVQLAFSTPDRLRCVGDHDKLTHRRALAGLVPPEILGRKDKAYFDETYHAYREKMHEHFAQSGWRLHAGDLVDPSDIQSLFQAWDAKRHGCVPAGKLFTLLTFEAFFSP